ncbi:MAG: GNAT family N-acetyltransferase [Candidatus Hodarchaeales archaeon]|jgi:ribosomal protein S18 acetylase RimI-like enzyme
MLNIRNITVKDLEWITNSIDQENWGHLYIDVKRCFDFEPNGCFITEIDGIKVGHAFSVGFLKFAWISLVITNPKYRKQGIASSLMERIFSHLSMNNIHTFFLDAVPNIADLYRKYGFQDQFESLRLIKTDFSLKNIELNDSIRLIEQNDLNKLSDFDQPYFGDNRKKVLTGLFNDYPEYCYLAMENETIVGYIMARKTTHGFWCGPFVCDPLKPLIINDLLTTCLQSLQSTYKEIRIGVLSNNKQAIKLFSSYGFTQVGKSIRMVRGTNKIKSKPDGVFGIAGPEKG